MLKKRILLHTVAWCAVFGFWVFISREHHPSLLINALATAVLVSVSAAGVYFNALILQPQYARTRSWVLYASLLIAAVIMLDAAAVLIIQTIYDHLRGPDPLRYGFWTNVLYEAVFIVLHLVGAMVVFRLSGRRQAERSNYAEEYEKS